MRLQEVGRRGRILTMLLSVGLFLQGCSKSDVETYDPFEYLANDVKEIDSYLSSNGINAKIDSASGVFIEIHKSGDGFKTIAGIEISAHFKGYTLDGEDFVNTFDGNPIDIVLGGENPGNATITNGLQVGLLNLFAGDSATIYVPSPRGFQNKTYQNVPPNSILVYDIKFVEINRLKQENELIDQYILDKNITAEIDSVFGTRYAIHRSGNNVTPKNGAAISLHYQGELLNGTIFDSSYESNQTLDFTFGAGSLIAGFEMGIVNLHENDSATIFIPSIYGYGENAQGDAIPANAVLVFGLDIKRISNL